MKKFIYSILVCAVACACLLFTGCTTERKLYNGDTSLVTNVTIKFPALDNSTATLSVEDRSIFMSYLAKTSVEKIEKPAAFTPRPAPTNYFAYVNVYGTAPDPVNLEFYVLADGKVEINGQAVASWYNSKLDDKSMNIITKYQGHNYKPFENLIYYSTGLARQVVDNSAPQVSKTYFATDAKDRPILHTFLSNLSSFRPSQVPTLTIVDNIKQTLPTTISGETYAFTFVFNPNSSTPQQKQYRFCGVVASSSTVRLVVEMNISNENKYLLADYTMDGTAIKDSIKALAIA